MSCPHACDVVCAAISIAGAWRRDPIEVAPATSSSCGCSALSSSWFVFSFNDQRLSLLARSG
jgi:hypothetical protein